MLTLENPHWFKGLGLSLFHCSIMIASVHLLATLIGVMKHRVLHSSICVDGLFSLLRGGQKLMFEVAWVFFILLFYYDHHRASTCNTVNGMRNPEYSVHPVVWMVFFTFYMENGTEIHSPAVQTSNMDAICDLRNDIAMLIHQSVEMLQVKCRQVFFSFFSLIYLILQWTRIPLVWSCDEMHCKYCKE